MLHANIFRQRRTKAVTMKLTRIIIACVTLLAALLTTTGCGEQTSGKQASDGGLEGKIILTGSSTVAPLALEIAKRFEQLHPGLRVDVQTGGSSRGIADVMRGTADIAMVSRTLKPEEADLNAHTFAMDGVGMIVHLDNPIQTLSDEQVVAIFIGRATNWSQVGGHDAPITVINKAEGRATLEVFLNHFGLSSRDIKASVVIGENQQGIRTVANNMNAIAYVSVGTADYELGRGVSIRLLPMDGVMATTDNVRNGSFPMSRPLSLVTHGTISPHVQAFIEYAKSSSVVDLVEAQYFVPIAKEKRSTK